MGKYVIAGNWKMNKTPAEAKELIDAIRPLVSDAKCDVIVGVPFVDLPTALEATKGTNIGVAAQNCHWEKSGAFTGEISAEMLKAMGVGYVILGHSERRSWATLLEKYLSTCKNLRALALLLDSRLPPQKLDLDLAGFARSCGLPLLPILTKADKCNQRERAARQAEWGEIVGVKPVITSSSKRMGMDALWQRLIEASGCAPVILEEEAAQPVTASLAEALARTTAATEEKA
mgnify:CR=1 FL=1